MGSKPLGVGDRIRKGEAMTNRATLEALLARVLEGTGSDRELDRAIAMALTPKARRGMYVRRHYTGSLDAALPLVPEGWHAEIGTRPDWHWARLFKWTYPAGNTEFISGPTPPRALIAACLKARMDAQPSSDT